MVPFRQPLGGDPLGLGFSARHAPERAAGHVVNTASIVGLVPIAQGNLGAYTTTKFALVGYSESLRAELQSLEAPIGVSVVCPGAVTTRIAESERNRPVTGLP
ncbi:MAG TPA: SDR family NAD(P)-dependent oxidoreductase [Myxococcales bacterium]|nr:SDR family NAD(P)-dependent oxidoreductase [Myxococcales bacterium]